MQRRDERGIEAIRAGNLEQALGRLQRALCLNPDHEPTRQQVQFLNQAVSATRCQG